MPTNGNCPNPRFLLADTSSILPLAIGGCLPTLKRLHSEYGIKTLITEKVEMEVRWHVNENQKFIGFKDPVYRALEHKLLSVLDDRFAEAHGLGYEFLDDVDIASRRLQGIGVDEGEAYTHAAATALGVPALTNDTAALRKLDKNGDVFPGAIRCFDIIGFAFQVNFLTNAMCDEARLCMIRANEGIERVFRHRSFTEGLTHFYLRLVDGNSSPVGSSVPVQKYDRDRFSIVKLGALPPLERTGGFSALRAIIAPA